MGGKVTIQYFSLHTKKKKKLVPCGVMVSDMLYPMRYLTPETVESYEESSIAGEWIRHKTMHFTNFAIAKERCFIRKQYAKKSMNK